MSVISKAAVQRSQKLVNGLDALGLGGMVTLRRTVCLDVSVLNNNFIFRIYRNIFNSHHYLVEYFHMFFFMMNMSIANAWTNKYRIPLRRRIFISCSPTFLYLLLKELSDTHFTHFHRKISYSLRMYTYLQGPSREW